MEKLKIRFQRFMVGRYGVDKLSTYLLYGGLAIVLLFNLLNWSIGGLLGWAAIILGYYRTFSRNRTKRYQENQKFLTFKRRIDSNWKKQRKKFQERKVYKYYLVPTVIKNCAFREIKVKSTSNAHIVENNSLKKLKLLGFHQAII